MKDLTSHTYVSIVFATPDRVKRCNPLMDVYSQQNTSQSNMLLKQNLTEMFLESDSRDFRTLMHWNFYHLQLHS